MSKNYEAGEIPEDESIPAPPELDNPALENLTTWDEPLDARGGAVDLVEPQDEEDVGLRLVQEGIAEADDEQRDSAAEVEPEEEQ